MKLTLNLASRTCINRRALYAFYAAGLIFLAAFLGWQLLSTRQLQAHGRQVRGHLAELEATAKQERKLPDIPPARRQQLQEEIAFANDLLVKDGFRWTALLNRLEGMGVDGVVLRSLHPDFKAGSLRLTGFARGVPQLREYLDRLLASPDFSEVYLLEQATTAVRDAAGNERQAVSFSLQLRGGF